MRDLGMVCSWQHNFVGHLRRWCAAHKGVIAPNNAVVWHGRYLAAAVMQSHDVVAFVFWWMLRVSVGRVVECEYVSRRDHRLAIP